MRSLARYSHVIGFILCAVLLGGAFYLEYAQEQLPCLLCQLQRIVMAVMGFIFLIAAIHRPQGKSRFVYFTLVLIVGIGGLLLAGRQLWLIAHPELVADAPCSPSLSYLVSVLPLNKVIIMSIQGSGDCAKATWHFLSLSLPAWSFISFAVLLILNFMALFGNRKSV
ncbi:MAG: disulfide bond formation protein B [Gammaproteobacteria bacterium]|nr:disulfide bond formation protein B [Gammaproteobacteria bacterium]